MVSRTFQRAVQDVRQELRRAGLDALLDRIELHRSWSILDHAGLALGLFVSGDRRRRIIGVIRIPVLTLPLINGWARWVRSWKIGSPCRISLRFVLRHEVGHALAHWLGCFGTPGKPWGSGTSFTPYAATSADEDLAETVAIFLTRRGHPPRRHLDQHLAAKWRAAGDLLHAGRRRCAVRSASPQPCRNTR